MFKILKNKFFLFLVVGSINAVFSYSLYAFLLMTGLHYTLATLITTILSVLFNFQSTGRIVFNNKNNNRLYRFVGVYVIIYLLNNCVLYVCDSFKANLYIAGALLILPMALVAFALNKKFVFNFNPENHNVQQDI